MFNRSFITINFKLLTMNQDVPVAQLDRASAFQWGHDLRNFSDVSHKAELIPSLHRKFRRNFQVFKLGIKGAFIRNGTYEVDVANSVDILERGQYRARCLIASSVETLRDGAVMPKIKSSQQAVMVVRVIWCWMLSRGSPVRIRPGTPITKNPHLVSGGVFCFVGENVVFP